MIYATLWAYSTSWPAVKNLEIPKDFEILPMIQNRSKDWHAGKLPHESDLKLF